MVREAGYSNRSEYIRDLIRDRIVEKRWSGNRIVVGTITLIYNHNTRQLSHKLTSVQHSHHNEILATTHVHMSKDVCAEMILVKGRAKKVQHIADQLSKQKGVLHTELSISSPDPD